MRFVVYPHDRVRDDAIEQAYFTGHDRSIWTSKSRRTEDGFEILRTSEESGCVHLPWEIAGRGELVLSTAWLIEREQPYHLQVELARGCVNRVRRQCAEWQDAGLEPSAKLISEIASAKKHFAQAATRQLEKKTAAAFAEQAISAALDAADELIDCYTEQAIAARRAESSTIPLGLGIRLDNAVDSPNTMTALEGSVECAAVPVAWGKVEHNERDFDWESVDRQINWAEQSQLKVLAGPLVAFDRRSAPAWGKSEAKTFDDLHRSAMEFTTAAVKRYRHRVAVWNCAARLNIGQALPLMPEDRLRIAVHTVDVIRRYDADTPIIMTFDRPWAEYMNRMEIDPPLYVADTLIRAGLGLAGVGLEINLGFEPDGSPPRDLLDISQLLDLWGIVDVPLTVFLTAPSAMRTSVTKSAGPLVNSRIAAGGPTPQWQASWLRKVLHVVLAKPFVNCVIWNQLSDQPDGRFPAAGLMDEQLATKPALDVLRDVRQKFIV
ncbi:MAG: hypothetical protein MPJ50_15530 [Pirellulales bacterium]|nr:hypothetical protein [Pirellulales bacterium]